MKIAIASGKGGTGKTTLSANLAHYAAQTKNITLVDLDVEEPNNNIFIQGNEIEKLDVFRPVPEWNKDACILCGKCTKWCKFSALLQLIDEILVLPELCHSCYACSELCPVNALPMQDWPLGVYNHIKEGNLDFFYSKLNIGVEQAVPLIAKTLKNIEELELDKELEIWDSPPGTSCSMLEVVKNADFVILVSEPTPFGLFDLTLAVESVRHINKPVGIVVNRYGIGNDEIFKYCEKEGLPIWATIPNKREIAVLYSKGELIYPHIPEFRAELDKILDNIEKIRGEQ
ncbi:MAG: ATP-binding protein [Candidatus Cloacimonas sp.]|nr:ATP-binding protein [Candidatus Cloacimonadota bacterium]